MVRYIEYERIKIFEERRGERERDIGCCEQALEPKFITNGGGEVWERSKYTFLSAYFTGRKRIGRRTHNGEAREEEGACSRRRGGEKGPFTTNSFD